MSFVESFTPYDFPKYGLVRLPKVEIDASQKAAFGLEPAATNLEFLRQLARKGFTGKISKIDRARHEEYGKRAKYELEVFEELGFTDYVLLVWQVINRARESGVFIDYGRGSCGGSLIFWLLGITGVDPVAKSLLFERFVSRTRSKKQVIDGEIYLQGDLIADADLNLGESRAQIVEWLHTVYPGRICKILNLSTFTGKILVKDVYKAYGEVTDEDAGRISALLDKHFGIVEDIKEAYKSKEPFKEWVDKNPDAYRICLMLNDLIRQTSVHASGYAITYDDLATTIPLECDKEGSIVSGFDMREVCNFSVKLDLLGLTTNGIIAEVRDQIDEDLDSINLDSDPLIYDQFQRGDLLPFGLYQISADCAYGVLNEIKPKNVFELSDVNACARPGALAYVDGYVKGNNPPAHPLFEPILARTRQYCLYQEQMMQLAMAIGFSADDAEILRKCVTDDTMFISKTRGYISIKELLQTGYKDDLFLVMDECGRQQWKHITNIWASGTKQVEYVRARNGMWVRATGLHQFLTDDGWKAKRNITEEDYLVCAKSISYEGKDTISSNMAMVIAGLVTEGYFVEGKNNSTFVNWDKELMGQFTEAFDREFGENRLKFDSLGRVARLNTADKLKIAGIMAYGKSNVKKLPSQMMGMTLETTKKFLGFMWSCEGTFTNKEISFTSASYHLIQQVQLLLLRFDVRSNLILKYNKKYDRNYYVLHVKQHADQKRMYEFLGEYLCTAKRKILLVHANAVRRLSHTTEMVPPRIMRRFIQQYPLRLLEGGSIYRHGASFTRFLRVAEDSKDKYWLDLARGKHEYSRVESVNDLYERDAQVYDFTVDDDTPYIVANGLVIHNCVGKKLVDKVKEWQAKIHAKVKEQGLPPNLGDILWKILDDSSKYSFNLAHSLTTSYLSALTVYLKYKYPTFFYCACFNAAKDLARQGETPQDQVVKIARELPFFGIKLLPPHLVHSSTKFAAEGDRQIRFGLSMIRGLGEKAAEKLDAFRSKASESANVFEVFQAAKNAGLNIGLVSSIIQAGCLEGYDQFTNAAGEQYRSRSRLVLCAQTWNILTDAEKGVALSIGHLPEINWDVLSAIKHMAEVMVNEKGKHPIIPRRFETIKKRYQPYKEIYQQNSANERLANLFYERHALGYSYSETVRGVFGDDIRGLTTVAEALKKPKDSLCRVLGFVQEDPRKGKTKKGNAELKMVVTDETGQVTVKAFNDRIDAIQEANGRLPVEGDLVCCSVKVMEGGDTLFIQNSLDGFPVRIVTADIFLGLADLRDAKEKATKVEPAT